MHTLYEIVLNPLSPFGTPLVGDTLFGHLAWQFACDESLLKKTFSKAIEEYQRAPFVVVSSALPRVVYDGRDGYAVRRPDLSLFMGEQGQKSISRRQKLEERKEKKKSKWLFVAESLVLEFSRELLMTEAAVTRGVIAAVEKAAGKGSVRSGEDAFILSSQRAHNSINRLTSTTGEGFAPYSQELTSYLPGSRLSVFALADPEVVGQESLHAAFSRIGSFGYGRDASSGLGRFDVVEVNEKEIPAIKDADFCYTLAPCLPGDGEVEKGWMQPVTRFGKHGGGAQLLDNPFKNPVVFAEDGAVFKLSASTEARQYIGCGLSGVSKTMPETVVQGFSPFLPCNVEV